MMQILMMNKSTKELEAGATRMDIMQFTELNLKI